MFLYVFNMFSYNELQFHIKHKYELSVNFYFSVQQTVTGELISSSNSAANTARQTLSKKLKINLQEVDDLINVGAHIPDPVFFCSIEPPSQVN